MSFKKAYVMGPSEVIGGVKYLLDLFQEANVKEYVIHGGAARILHGINKNNPCKTRTRDVDVFVFSYEDINSIEKVLGEMDLRDKCPLVYEKYARMGELPRKCGLDVLLDKGRIEIRKPQYFGHMLAAIEPETHEIMTLSKGVIGIADDLKFNIRPLELVKETSKRLIEIYNNRINHQEEFLNE